MNKNHEFCNQLLCIIARDQKFGIGFTGINIGLFGIFKKKRTTKFTY